MSPFPVRVFIAALKAYRRMHLRQKVASLMVAGVCAVVSAAAEPAPAAARDWTGWRGPDRTGVSTETGLLKQWPPGGPRLVWKATGLGGYSTPSVAGGRLKEKGRFRQPDRNRFATFCHPVVAGGRLYLRDEGLLLCYGVKEK